MNIDLKGGSSSYTKGMVVGALIGGAVSGLAALLFAPKRGVELRRDIASKTGETYSNIASKAGHLAQDAASRVTSFVDHLQTRNEHKAGSNGNGSSAAAEKSTQSAGAASGSSSGSKNANS